MKWKPEELFIGKEKLQFKYELIHFDIRKKISKCLPDIKSKRFFQIRSPNRFQNIVHKYVNNSKNQMLNFIPKAPLSPQPRIIKERNLCEDGSQTISKSTEDFEKFITSMRSRIENCKRFVFCKPSPPS